MDPSGLVLVILLLALSGFFSACETAFISISPAKVRALLDKKMPGSSFLSRLKENPHRTLITILLGSNFVNIAASALTTVLVTQAFGSEAIGIATGILTLLVLFFGEVMPKSFAAANPELFSLISAPILYFLGLILTPLIWFLDRLVDAALRLFGLHKKKSITDEELIAMATIGAEEGAFGQHEVELIENVLEFTDIRVGEIMTPRIHIDSMPEDYDMKEAAEFIINHTHSRLPVYRDTIDHIVGVVSLKEIIKHLHEEEDDHTLRQVTLFNPPRVPVSMPVHDLFLLFKKHKQHMAIVVDEFGGTAGLVTMEDLLEELVGDIEDESDKEEDYMKKISDIEYEVSGRIQLEELEELIQINFDEPGHKSISSYLAEKLGRTPRKEDKVVHEDWEFEVTHVWRSTVLKVKVHKR